MAKKFDMKQAAVAHAEKAVFGIIVLVVLASLAGTKWSPYKGTPEEILAKVESGRRNLQSHGWPEEEKERFFVSNEKKPANIVERELFSPLNIARYELSNKFLRVLGADREPLREPDLVAPEDVRVSTGRVFIQLYEDPLAPSTESEELAAAETTPAEDDDLADEFRQRTPGMVPGIGGMDEYGGDYYAVELYGGGDSYGAGYTGDAGDDSGYGPEGESMYGMGMPAVKIKGEGFHYAAVRAVFNYRDQIRKFADAIHRPLHEAAKLFQLIDFQLERQTRLPGDDPWSGPWEPVDIKVARDVLEKCAGYEPDVVNSMVTDAVITMPLPMRITGMWKKDATHPKIANFELSAEEMKIEMEINKKLLEEFVEQKRKEKESVVQRGGFAQDVFDPRGVQSQLLGMDSAYDSYGYDSYGYDGDSGYGGGYGGGGGFGAGGLRSGMGTPPPARGSRPKKDSKDPSERLLAILMEGIDTGKPDAKKQEEALRDWIKKRTDASTDLLLFRYFDFSVEPGKTYRYRVRFVVTNPNYNRRIAEAGGLAHVVEGPTRETDWSEPSAPITVAPSMNYFLTSVRAPSGFRVFPTALLDAYQYDSSFGTFVNNTIEVVLGQKVGGERPSEIYKPAESKVESSERYRFSSNDVLVDAIDEIEIDNTFHGGEKLDRNVRLKSFPNGRLGLNTIILVEQGDEGLKLLDGIARESQRQQWVTYMANQKKQFEYLTKQAEMMATAGLGGELGDIYGDPTMMYEGDYSDAESMMFMGGERGRNYLRKGKVSRTKSGTFRRQGGAMMEEGL